MATSKRSRAVRKTWKDPRVAAARAHRDGVKVWGHGEFPSTLAAFKSLHLPEEKHIGFRKQLKHDGKAVFVTDHKRFTFRIV